MAVLGRLLVGSQQRVDLTDFLSIDSYAAGDFKFLIKSLSENPMVLKGFEIIDAPLAIGSSAVSVKVSDSVVYYPSSTAGCFFYGLPEGNQLSAPVVPELRTSATNYLYLVLTTSGTAQDSRAFWDPDLNGGTGGEFNQDVNTESVLRVEVGVSVSTFPEDTVPLCKVVVNSTGIITSITDCRNMMFRLGKGGVNPNPLYTYAWKNEPSSTYARNETPGTIVSSASPTPFAGGDKNISDLKSWIDAVMTKLLEISGTTYWYEGTNNITLPSLFDDAIGSTIKSKGRWQHDGATPGLVKWTEDIVYKKINDPRDVIVRANPTTGAQLQNEQVLYVAMKRDDEVNPLNTSVDFANGLNYINGPVGAFEYIRKGDWIKKQSDDQYLYYRVEELYSLPALGGVATTSLLAQSVRLSSTYSGATETAVAVRTQGEFRLSPAEWTIADRNDAAMWSQGTDAYWLALRSDTIMSNASIVPVFFSGTVDITDSDGVRAKLTFPSPHGLADGYRIVVSGAGGDYDGIKQVEVDTATTCFITTTAVTNPSSVTVKWATVTTQARTNGYSYQLESSEHGFNSGETVFISSADPDFNGAYELAVVSTTQFQIPYGGAQSTPSVSLGSSTVARVILRTEFGAITVVQGQDIDIGGDIQDLMDFIGMTSLSQNHPDYAIPSDANGLKLLSGSQNYNSDPTDSLTDRVSRLTGMMMDRVQDRDLGFHGRVTLRNATSGGDQIVTVNGTLEISKPGSSNQTVTLASSYSLAVNQAVVAVIDRNGSGAITPTIETLLSPFLIDENKIVLISRFSGTSVYWTDGSEIKNSSSYTFGQLEDSQSKSVRLHDIAGIRFDVSAAPPTGVLSFASTLANNEILIPGSSSNIIDTAAFNALSSSERTLPDGSCVWARINRRAVKTFNNTNTSATYQDSDASGTLYVTSLSSVPVDQDVVVLYINQDGALLKPLDLIPNGNVYEEDKVVVSTPPSNDNELLGPVLSGAIVTLPFDSRDFDSTQYYVVGSGQLEVYLSGQRLRLTEDWLEVGSSGSLSNQIQIQQDLVIGDVLTFRIGTTGAVYFTPQSPSSGTLQTAYDNGNIINTTSGTPVTINGTGGKLLVVNGDVDITGVIDPKGIEFSRELSDPLGSGSDGLWVNTGGELVQKRGASPSINITESITNPSSFLAAGDGLSYSGSTLNINTDSSSGIAVATDQVTLVKDAAGAIVGDSITGVKVNLEPSNASLEISSNQLRLKRKTDSALLVDGGGVGVQVESVDPSLQISSNELGVKLDPAGSVIKGSGGVAVQLESTNPSLQISSNRLGVKLNSNGAITSGSSGIGLQVDSSLNISGNVLGVANVGTILTDLTNNTGSLVGPGIAVAADATTGQFILANAGALSSAQRYVGVTYATIADSAVGKIQIGGVATVPGATFVVGQPVYLDTTAGVFTNTAPTATGAAILVVGTAVAADKFVMATYLVGIKGNIYEETYIVPAPISSGGSLTLPVDSRDGYSAQNYRVGSGDLEVALNGQKLRIGDDYTEVGAVNTFSTSIQIQQDLVTGDVVTFRVAPTQTSFGGGSLVDPTMSAGDLIYRNPSNTIDRLAAGTTGQVLTVTSPGVVEWANNPAGFSDPMTTAGDLIYKNSGGTTTRLPIGVAGQILTVTGSSTVSWSSPAAVSQEILLENNTGSTIPAFQPVRANTAGDMDYIDVSVEAQSLAIVGVTKTTVPDTTAGSLVTSGRLENVTGSFTFGDVLYVSKTGLLTSTKPDIGVDGFLAGDWVIKLGVVTKNQTNPILKDVILQVQLMGQL